MKASMPVVLNARQVQEVYDTIRARLEETGGPVPDSRSTYGTVLRNQANQNAMVIDKDSIFCFAHQMIEHDPDSDIWSVLLPGTTK